MTGRFVKINLSVEALQYHLEWYLERNHRNLSLDEVEFYSNIFKSYIKEGFFENYVIESFYVLVDYFLKTSYIISKKQDRKTYNYIKDNYEVGNYFNHAGYANGFIEAIDQKLGMILITER